MRTPIALLPMLLSACAATAVPAEPPPEAVEARVQEELRALFPDVRGPLDRASIAAALEAERRAARPAELRPVEDALAAGDLERAHARLSAVLRERALARARAAVDAGTPREALAVLDRAQELAPRDPEVLRLRGDCALAIGLEDGDASFLEDALESFRASASLGAGPRAWVGASRAARALGRPSEALAHAGRALGVDGAVEASIALGAQRALSEASFDLYLEAKRDARADASEVERRFERARAALEGYCERAPRDPWAHERLASLLERQGEPAQAVAELVAALDLAPEDAALHRRLGEVARALGGREAVLEAYDDLLVGHPRSPAVLFHATVELFDAALAESLAEGATPGRDAVASFRACERDFARCRALEPAWSEACLGYEVMCRDAVGWCRLAAGELAEAHEAFLSADDLMPGRGLLWEIPGRLRSGVRGLAEVADASNRLGNDPNSLERATHMGRASKIFDFLHAYQPESVDWANNAGFFNRDSAVLLEQRARALARQGEVDQANRLLVRARELMEKSYRAYVDACALAPEDVRLLNDTALILTYYLQREVPEAKRLLLRAVALGEEQIPALRARLAAAPEEQRGALQRELEALEIAFGDACENLGVLHLTLEGDPKAARRWFERALAEGGPDPRPVIDGRDGRPDPWLERCARAEAGTLDPLVREGARWAAPIPEPNRSGG